MDMTIGPDTDTWSGDDLVDQLIDLARILGGAPRRYAILGEGNVSARMDTSIFLVKASGTVMATATAQSLVRVDLTRAMELVHAPQRMMRPLP